MDLAIAMPMPVAVPAKNNSNALSKKAAGLPFGDVLGAALTADPEAAAFPKEDTPAELPGQLSPDPMFAAFMPFFQPSPDVTGLTAITSGQMGVQAEVPSINAATSQNPFVYLQASIPSSPQSANLLPGTQAFPVLLPVNGANVDTSTQLQGLQQSAAVATDNLAPGNSIQAIIPPVLPAIDVSKPGQPNQADDVEAKRTLVTTNAVRSIADTLPTVSQQKPNEAGSSPMKADIVLKTDETAVFHEKTNVLAMQRNREGQASGSEMSQERQSDPKQAVTVTVLQSNDTHATPHIPFETMVQGAGSLQKTTSVSPEQTSIPEQDPYGIGSQIVEHAKLISRPQNTEMIIKLKPEHLGELTFRITVEQGAVSASFHSNNPEVRSIIENGLPQLKQELSSQGLKVDTVGVFTSLAQFSQDPRGSQQQYQQADIPLSRRPDNDFTEEIEAIIQNTNVVDSQLGVDYRV